MLNIIIYNGRTNLYHYTAVVQLLHMYKPWPCCLMTLSPARSNVDRGVAPVDSNPTSACRLLLSVATRDFIIDSRLPLRIICSHSHRHKESRTCTTSSAISNRIPKNIKGRDNPTSCAYPLYREMWGIANAWSNAPTHAAATLLIQAV